VVAVIFRWVETRSLTIAFMTAAFLLLTACSSTSGSRNSSPGPLSGNWQIVLQAGDTSNTQSGFVLQSGKSLRGQFLLTGDCAGVGAAQGEMDGANVSLTVNQSAQTIGLTGTTGSDDSTISGNYSILQAGCGTSQTGTWTATRVKNLNGSFTAAFTSGVSGVAPFSFSGSVTQGSNQGTSQASLAGSMSSTDAACFSSASVSGVISGTSVVLNFVSSEGAALGQLKGIASADATTITGTYDFFNAQVPIQGCPSGDFGSVAVSVQPQ
jgi:hypothetical protein